MLTGSVLRLINSFFYKQLSIPVSSYVIPTRAGFRFPPNSSNYSRANTRHFRLPIRAKCENQFLASSMQGETGASFSLSGAI